MLRSDKWNCQTRNFGFLLHDVARLMRKRFEQNARDLGLTRSQCSVLAHLARNEGIQQGGLAEILEVEPITLTRILDRLEDAGLVERARPSHRPPHPAAASEAGGASPAERNLRHRSRHPRRGAGRREPRQTATVCSQVLSTMKTNLLVKAAAASGDRRASHG